MSSPNISVAILGIYAGIKICKKAGYDWRQVAEIVEPIATEHAQCEQEQSTEPNGSASPQVDGGQSAVGISPKMPLVDCG